MLPDSKLQFFLPGSLFFVGTVLKYFVSVYKENILLIYEKQDTINFFASLLWVTTLNLLNPPSWTEFVAVPVDWVALSQQLW